MFKAPETYNTYIAPAKQVVSEKLRSMGRKISMIGATTAAMVGSAHAAVPTNVSTAITDAGADAATVGGLVLVAVIGIYAIKFIRRAL